MPLTLVNPQNEAARETRNAAPKLDSLKAKRVGLLDISKPGGSIFLDRLEHLLKDRFGVAEVLRISKPTYTRPAPDEVIEKIRHAQCHAIIEALAD